MVMIACVSASVLLPISRYARGLWKWELARRLTWHKTRARISISWLVASIWFECDQAFTGKLGKPCKPGTREFLKCIFAKNKTKHKRQIFDSRPIYNCQGSVSAYFGFQKQFEYIFFFNKKRIKTFVNGINVAITAHKCLHGLGCPLCTDWLSQWLDGWLDSWLAGWPAGWLAGVKQMSVRMLPSWTVHQKSIYYSIFNLLCCSCIPFCRTFLIHCS